LAVSANGTTVTSRPNVGKDEGLHVLGGKIRAVDHRQPGELVHVHGALECQRMRGADQSDTMNFREPGRGDFGTERGPERQDHIDVTREQGCGQFGECRRYRFDAYVRVSVL